MLEAYGRMQPPPRSRICKPQALEPMVKLYEAWDKPDQATEWRAKLPTTQPVESATRTP